jgi:hypothetical protein
LRASRIVDMASVAIAVNVSHRSRRSPRMAYRMSSPRARSKSSPLALGGCYHGESAHSRNLRQSSAVP